MNDRHSHNVLIRKTTRSSICFQINETSFEIPTYDITILHMDFENSHCFQASDDSFRKYRGLLINDIRNFIFRLGTDLKNMSLNNIDFSKIESGIQESDEPQTALHQVFDHIDALKFEAKQDLDDLIAKAMAERELLM